MENLDARAIAALWSAGLKLCICSTRRSRDVYVSTVFKCVQHVKNVQTCEGHTMVMMDDDGACQCMSVYLYIYIYISYILNT